MTETRRLALALAAAAAVVGCGAPDEAADQPTRSPTSAEETTVDPTTSPTSSSAPRGVDLAVDDLAATLGVDASDVEVVSVEEVTWRDGSRGCARKGMVYTQALVEGSRITLRAGGRTYEYHAGGSHPPTRCDTPTE